MINWMNSPTSQSYFTYPLLKNPIMYTTHIKCHISHVPNMKPHTLQCNRMNNWVCRLGILWGCWRITYSALILARDGCHAVLFSCERETCSSRQHNQIIIPSKRNSHFWSIIIIVNQKCKQQTNFMFTHVKLCIFNVCESNCLLNIHVYIALWLLNFHRKIILNGLSFEFPIPWANMICKSNYIWIEAWILSTFD